MDRHREPGPGHKICLSTEGTKRLRPFGAFRFRLGRHAAAADTNSHAYRDGYRHCDTYCHAKPDSYEASTSPSNINVHSHAYLDTDRDTGSDAHAY